MSQAEKILFLIGFLMIFFVSFYFAGIGRASDSNVSYSYSKLIILQQNEIGDKIKDIKNNFVVCEGFHE